MLVRRSIPTDGSSRKNLLLEKSEQKISEPLGWSRNVRTITCSFSRSALLFYLLISSGFFRNGAIGLKCYVCSNQENPTFTLDASLTFRIVDELAHDHCRKLEEVECDRDQDICVTIVQYKIDEGSRGPRSYSVSMGCYRSSVLDLGVAAYKRRCHKETAEVKEDVTSGQFRSRRINIHQAVRHTCICNSNRCNSANGINTRHSSFFLEWSHAKTCLANLLIIVYMPLFMLRNP